MEEGQENQISVVGNPPMPPGAARRKKGKTGLLVIGIFLLLAAVGAGIYFIGKSKQEPEATPTPTPFIRGTETVSTPEPAATPEAVDKEDVSIEVLNGTGVPGEAGFLQGKLKALGYSQIEVGNATSQDNEATSVVFSDKLPASVVEEITKMLEDTFKTLKTRKSSSGSVDISITTGLRKGATPKPASTSTPTPKATSTASPTPLVSPSPSPTGN